LNRQMSVRVSVFTLRWANNESSEEEHYCLSGTICMTPSVLAVFVFGAIMTNPRPYK
jgi:hypothetical protein